MSKSKYYSDSFSGKDIESIINKSTGKLHADLVGKLQAAIEKHLNTINSEIKKITEPTVYTGLSGVAQLFLYIGRRLNRRSYITRADDMLAHVRKQLRKKRISYLTGEAGPIALSAVTFHSLGKKDEAMAHVDRLKSFVTEAVADNTDVPDELLYGRVGYLYALLLVNQVFGSDVIDAHIIREVVTKVLESGQTRSKAMKSKVPLEYEWHGKNYYGAAHGVAGILYVLLLARRHLTDVESHSLVKPTLDNLLSVRFPTGNLPSSQGSDSDRLVQWCHGAPGFVQLLSLAHTEYGDSSYQAAAMECGEVVWKRGLLTKGYSICHGVAGNAYTFLHLYQLTGDVTHLFRAGCFAEWCLTLPNNQYCVPDRPYSLFEGLAGVVYFLQDVQDPDRAGFPAFSLNF